MSYIEDIADAIQKRIEDLHGVQHGCDGLWRFYALLCLTQGVDVTAHQVHDAWAAWQSARDPNHRSLIPFNALSEEVQWLDFPYRDAIAWVADKKRDKIIEGYEELQAKREARRQELLVEEYRETCIVRDQDNDDDPFMRVLDAVKVQGTWFYPRNGEQ